MTQYAETFDSYDVVGEREDLEDAIYDISPLDTPFMSNVDRESIKAVSHEWQTDVLAAASDANAHIEGDDIVTGDAIVATERLHNISQISWKVVIVSGTADAINKAGRKNELGYQVSKAARELKRDLEAIYTSDNPLTVGSGTVARQLCGMECWYDTNTSRGAGGADAAHTLGQPDAAAAPTDGTTRPFTESLLKAVIQATWVQGGDPTLIMTGAFNKVVASGFTGGSTRTDKGEDKRLTAAIDIYVSDFGTHRLVPNRFSRSMSVHVLDPTLWAVGFLRSFRTEPLAKTGDANKRLLLAEHTLICRNEKGNGYIGALTAA